MERPSSEAKKLFKIIKENTRKYGSQGDLFEIKELEEVTPESSEKEVEVEEIS